MAIFFPSGGTNCDSVRARRASTGLGVTPKGSITNKQTKLVDHLISPRSRKTREQASLWTSDWTINKNTSASSIGGDERK